VLFRLEDGLLCDEVYAKCDDGDAKTGEEASELSSRGEDGRFTPGLTFRPRISVEGSVGH